MCEAAMSDASWIMSDRQANDSRLKNRLCRKPRTKVGNQLFPLVVGKGKSDQISWLAHKQAGALLGLKTKEYNKVIKKERSSNEL